MFVAKCIFRFTFVTETHCISPDLPATAGIYTMMAHVFIMPSSKQKLSDRTMELFVAEYLP